MAKRDMSIQDTSLSSLFPSSFIVLFISEQRVAAMRRSIRKFRNESIAMRTGARFFFHRRVEIACFPDAIVNLCAGILILREAHYRRGSCRDPRALDLEAKGVQHEPHVAARDRSFRAAAAIFRK